MTEIVSVARTSRLYIHSLKLILGAQDIISTASLDGSTCREPVIELIFRCTERWLSGRKREIANFVNG